MNIIEITDMQSGLKGMTKGRASVWDEMHADMVNVGGEICADHNEAAEHMHATKRSAG